MNQFFSTVVNPSSRRIFFFYLLPGGTFNLILCLVSTEKDLQFLIDKYLSNLTSSSLYVTIFLCLSIITGLIFENLGSRWEANYCKYKVLNYIEEDDDGVHRKIKDASVGINPEQIISFGWERFLSIQYNSEKLNGHRFLRYMLERLKFELSFGVATYLLYLLMILKGVISLFSEMSVEAYELASIPLLLILCRYLLATEAPLSAQTLHECRLIIVTNYDNSWKNEIEFFNTKKIKEKPTYHLLRFLWINFLFASLLLRDDFMGIRSIQKKRKKEISP